MPGNLTLADLKKRVKDGSIDTVVACAPDMQGRLMGKRFHAQFFVDSGYEETHCCNYLLAIDYEMNTVPGYRSASWEAGYGDYVMKPDLSTLRLIPWLPGTALVLCDLLDHHSHELVDIAPRTILKRQIARLDKLGLRAFAATELEFFLYRESYEEARDKGYRGLTTFSPYNEDYHIFQTTKEESIMRAIRNGLHGAGVVVENTKGEADAGQGEVNYKYSDVLDTGDTHVLIKNAVKEIAWQQGRAITFMAKPHHTMAGSSSHIHQSLWTKDGKSAFHDPKGRYGMSELMEHYLAGLLAHANEITYFLAPFINSYKRFSAGTFAPTKAVWSADNRTAGYRICGTDTKAVRIECRVGGADLNPYLALASQIAAGLAGIEGKMKLEPEFSGDAYAAAKVRDVPSTLRDAGADLKKSKMLRAAFGDEVVDHYAHAAWWEQEDFDRKVTDYEIERGFERG
jgi:glutamine synthetase